MFLLRLYSLLCQSTILFGLWRGPVPSTVSFLYRAGVLSRLEVKCGDTEVGQEDCVNEGADPLKQFT